jgi:hypothetical protein
MGVIKMSKFKAPKSSYIARKVGVNTSELYKMQNQLEESARKDRNKKVNEV